MDPVVGYCDLEEISFFSQCDNFIYLFFVFLVQN